MSLISIIIPVYNSEQYLDRCINSVLDQTHEDLELILVNDGSTDKSGEICDSFALNDERIKVIHKKNGGPSEARNVGLDMALGQYIGFVDSDDYVAEDMYECLLRACLDNKADIAVCGRFDVLNGTPIPSFTFNGVAIWDSESAIGNLLTWNNIDSAPWDKLYKRVLFEDIRFPMDKCNEDMFIMVPLLHKANRVVHIGVSKYYYCHRANSRSSGEFSECKMHLLEACEQITLFVKKNYPKLERKSRSFYYSGLIHLSKLLQTTQKKADYRESYYLVSKLLKRDLCRILSDQYLDVRTKIIALSLATNSYPFVKKVGREVQHFFGHSLSDTN